MESKLDTIRIAVGYDERESVAYHTFVQSIIDTCTTPISVTPLVLKTIKNYSETHQDGSNAFIYSRFLTPLIFNYDGWAIYADGDMICMDDMKNLWSMRSEKYAVMVAKHDYRTKATKKYLGNKNQDYPRKNWSSLILWNCTHPSNACLTADFVSTKTGSYLHRFSWLSENEIGELPLTWNWLTSEYPDNNEASLLHFTLGTPCFKEYSMSAMSHIWHEAHKKSQSGVGD